eukprot:2008969-Amphidinium_carterae.1
MSFQSSQSTEVLTLRRLVQKLLANAALDPMSEGETNNQAIRRWEDHVAASAQQNQMCDILNRDLEWDCMAHTA